MMTIRQKSITSNQYYGGLNRRFDRRFKLLRKLGYRYTSTMYGGVFIKQTRRQDKITSLHASMVMNSLNRDFIQALNSPISQFVYAIPKV